MSPEGTALTAPPHPSHILFIFPITIPFQFFQAKISHCIFVVLLRASQELKGRAYFLIAKLYLRAWSFVASQGCLQ